MAVFDLDACEVVELDNFWLQKDKRRPIKGNLGISNLDCTKIFASGFEGSQHILIYHKHLAERKYKPIGQDYSNFITTWMCAERSYSQEFIFIGGMNVDIPTIGALAFNETLALITFTKLTKVKSRSLSRLKRIEGTDFIMVGMIQELLVMKFDKTEFQQLHTFLTFMDYEISSIQFHTNHIFYATLGEQVLGVFELKSQVTQSEYYSTGSSGVTAESMNPLLTEFYDMKLGLKKQTVSQAPRLEDVKDVVRYLASQNISYKVVDLVH